MNQIRNLKIFLIFVYLGFGVISILHTIEFWQIANQPDYAVILAVVNSIAIISAIWLTLYQRSTARILFWITFAYEFLGNIFYSYHWLQENKGSRFFEYWCNLNQWMFEPFLSDIADYPKHMEIISAYLLGGVVPVLQGIVFFSILKMSTDKPQSGSEPVPPEPVVIEPILPEPILPTPEPPLEPNEPEEPNEPTSPEPEEPIVPMEPEDVVEPPVEESIEEPPVDTNDIEDTTPVDVIGGNKKPPLRPLYVKIKDDFSKKYSDLYNYQETDTDREMLETITDKSKQWKLKKTR